MDKKRKFNEEIIDTVLKNNNIIDSGASTVHNCNFYIKKYNRNFNNSSDYDDISAFDVNSYHHYLVEIEILPTLEKYNLSPKLITYDSNTLMLSNCGSVINKENIPSNWKDQIYNIYNMLRNENLYHNDFTLSNVTVLNGKIFLIDFGWASYDNPQYPFFNLTKNIIENSENLFDLFNQILNRAINVRLSNVQAYNYYINNDCRKILNQTFNS